MQEKAIDFCECPPERTKKTFRKIACCGQINNRKSLVAAILIFAKIYKKNDTYKEFCYRSWQNYLK
ncbi:MAG TPA: hypothetical protein DHU79_00340 [Clostridiales bacterium]|nr:hypothetical protein [Clostridiales bacterium]